MRNTALDHHRKNRLAPSDDLETTQEDPSLSPEALAERQQMTLLLSEMVAMLPRIYREVCRLRFGEHLSTAETAQRLSISQSNVTTRLERAVKMLRTRMDARLGKERRSG